MHGWEFGSIGSRESIAGSPSGQSQQDFDHYGNEYKNTGRHSMMWHTYVHIATSLRGTTWPNWCNHVTSNLEMCILHVETSSILSVCVGKSCLQSLMAFDQFVLEHPSASWTFPLMCRASPLFFSTMSYAFLTRCWHTDTPFCF